ncbi:hypothetical protein BDV93DRAFT_610057 [Ceratobasidium sp. AG-I]|nr:hypothetical protein BDV93DRAFT_610057 [Ceratobasidium sp. AG-I]
MGLSEELTIGIAGLKQRLDDFEYDVLMASDEKDNHDEGGHDDEKFIMILKDVCALVRRAQLSNNAQLPELVEAAQEILNQGVNFAYGESDMFDFLPSWAHDDELGEPLIEDRGEASFIRGQMPKRAASSWNKCMKRHPDSSFLARFRSDLPTLTPTSANPLAMCVYDARCDITSRDVALPTGLQLSRGSSCLALNAMDGYADLCYFILGNDGSGLPNEHFQVTGLADTANQMALDESRRLIFLGDDDRIKSYAWGTPGGDNYERLLPMHTLHSGRANGPIAVLANGTVVRADEGSASVWSLEGLQTHGQNADKRIRKIKVKDSWWNNPDEIEQSPGSQPTSELTFADNPDLKPSRWQPLIESPSSMLCTTSKTDSGEIGYDCFVLDLEHGGKVATRFLGHGGVVSDFSVSASDPQVFLTACNDGFARLYDLRRPLPVLTLDACGQYEFCGAVALAHPDGIPTVFTGTSKAEQIKVWDVRARTPVYELATGNNSVSFLAWDAERNSLYAATETSHMDQQGCNQYRRANIPEDSYNSHPRLRVLDIVSKMESRLDDLIECENSGFVCVGSDEDSFDGDERCWPINAMHNEDYFGYTFDAGQHRIYCYRFNKNSSPDVLPEYGEAEVDGH